MTELNVNTQTEINEPIFVVPEEVFDFLTLNPKLSLCRLRTTEKTADSFVRVHNENQKTEVQIFTPYSVIFDCLDHLLDQSKISKLTANIAKVLVSFIFFLVHEDKSE